MENNKIEKTTITNRDIEIFIILFLAIYHGIYIYTNLKK